MVNVQTEFNALAYIMRQRNPELLVAITPEHFGNGELAKIFQMIRRFYVDNGDFIGWDVLRAQVAKACKTQEKTKFLLSLLDQIEQRDLAGMTDDLLLQELRDFMKFRLVLDKVKPLISAVEVKDIDATLGKLKELHDSVFVDSEYRLEDADMLSMARRNIKFNFRKTGIKPIDDIGGLIVGGLTIIAAKRKLGKSTLAGMIAKHQYLHEEGSVAIFSYEMGADEVRARILSNYSDVDLGDIMADQLSPKHRDLLLRAEADFLFEDAFNINIDTSVDREEFFTHLAEAYTPRRNKLFIFDERLNWDELFVKMKLLVTTRNVKTIIVDYPFLVPRGRAYKELASWEYHLQMNRNLKTLAHEHGLNVISLAQLDEGKKGESPRLKFITNATNDCDMSLFISESQDDKTLGAVTVTFDALRNFVSKNGYPEPFKLAKELNKSRFSYLEY